MHYSQPDYPRQEATSFLSKEGLHLTYFKTPLINSFFIVPEKEREERRKGGSEGTDYIMMYI